MFKDLQLSHDILDAIDAMGYKDPTPVQEQSIPIILDGYDLMAFAQTGTGKTAAYLLPMVDIILDLEKSPFVKALIIAPTRELAAQIDQQLQGMAYYTPIDSLAVYGGGDGIDFSQAKKALENGASIIIATPGRLMSHIKMGYVDLTKLEFFVLDEADKMLDMGFLPDILTIQKHLSGKQQNLMFSATMNPKIKSMAKTLLNNPKEVSIELAKPAEGVIQAAYLVHNSEKIRLIKHLLKDKTDQKMIIFAGSKITVDNIARSLNDLKIGVQAFHSGFEQKDREEIMLNFRSGKVKVLIATDIVSRGIDIDDIDLIINFDAPTDAEDYVHRVGRTARAQRSGLALSFINAEEVHKFQKIEKLIDRIIHKIALPEGFPPGPEYKTGDFKRTFNKNKRHNHFNKNKSGNSDSSQSSAK